VFIVEKNDPAVRAWSVIFSGYDEDAAKARFDAAKRELPETVSVRLVKEIDYRYARPTE
jgi:hypothetical protein